MATRALRTPLPWGSNMLASPTQHKQLPRIPRDCSRWCCAGHFIQDCFYELPRLSCGISNLVSPSILVLSPPKFLMNCHVHCYLKMVTTPKKQSHYKLQNPFDATSERTLSNHYALPTSSFSKFAKYIWLKHHQFPTSSFNNVTRQTNW